jgi:hypothetical protein
MRELAAGVESEKLAASMSDYWAECEKRDEDARTAAQRGVKGLPSNLIRWASDRLEEVYGHGVIEALDINAVKDALGRYSGVERPLPPTDGDWFTAELADIADAGVPAVEYLRGDFAHRMIYSEGVTGFSGHPESGKTSLAVRLGLDYMRADGHVVYLDYENQTNSTVRRLTSLGAESHEYRGRLHYRHRPGEPDWERFARLAAMWPGALWIIDSSRGFLGSRGINENDASEVGQMMNPLVDFALEHALPLILIDHVTKAEDGNSGYARGSGDKLAGVQAQYYIEKTRFFSDRQPGEIGLKCWKEREGGLDYRHRFKVGDGHGNLTFERLDAEATPEAQMDAEIIALLKGLGDEGASLNEIESVNGAAVKIRARVKDLAETEGRPVKTVEGAGGHVRYAFKPGDALDY